MKYWICCLILMLSLGSSTFSDSSQMSTEEAVVLGLVEGLTEYLPVSSTGHLILASRLMGMDDSEVRKDAVDAYTICIQAGAILAVLVLYWRRFKAMLLGAAGKDDAGKKMGILLVVAFIPAAVFGLLLNKKIKAVLFGIWPIVAAWLIGGIAILWIARSWKKGELTESGKPLEDLTFKDAVTIGLLQCIAMWPGTSRSLMTILGGRFVGLKMDASVEFSFLLGLITLGAATVYEGYKSGALIFSVFGWQAPMIGFVVGFISAIISVKWMVGYINRYGLALFGWYRILLAFVVGYYAYTGYFS